MTTLITEEAGGATSTATVQRKASKKPRLAPVAGSARIIARVHASPAAAAEILRRLTLCS